MKLLSFIIMSLLRSFSSFAQETDREMIGQGDSCNVYNTIKLIDTYRKENNTAELKRVLERSVKYPLHISLQLDFFAISRSIL